LRFFFAFALKEETDPVDFALAIFLRVFLLVLSIHIEITLYIHATRQEV
jgi:hypothetical protein